MADYHRGLNDYHAAYGKGQKAGGDYSHYFVSSDPELAAYFGPMVASHLQVGSGPDRAYERARRASRELAEMEGTTLPDPDQPPVFFPGVFKLEEARDVNILPPPPLPPHTIQIEVVWPDGRPVAGADAKLWYMFFDSSAVVETGNAGREVLRPLTELETADDFDRRPLAAFPETDNEGRATLRTVQGIRYRLHVNEVVRQERSFPDSHSWGSCARPIEGRTEGNSSVVRVVLDVNYEDYTPSDPHPCREASAPP